MWAQVTAVLTVRSWDLAMACRSVLLTGGSWDEWLMGDWFVWAQVRVQQLD